MYVMALDYQSNLLRFVHDKALIPDIYFFHSK